MGDRQDELEAVSVSVEHLIPAAARNGCYTIREMRKAVLVLAERLESLTECERRVVEKQLPRGLFEGFKAYVKRANKVFDALTRNQPKLREFFVKVEDLPFTWFDDVLSGGSERVVRITAKDYSLPSRHPDTSEDEHRAIADEAAAALLLLKFLAVLSLNARRTYPALLLLFLLRLANAVLLASGPVGQFVPECPPVRVTGPPGRLVLAQPRVARAPGRDASLAANSSEGRVEPGAPWGSALLT